MEIKRKKKPQKGKTSSKNLKKNAKQKINTKKVLQTNKQLDEFNELARTWDEDLCE